jgi:hypothetical protein
MKNIFMILALLLLIFDSSYAQKNKDSIVVEKSFWNDTYYQNGKEITKRHVIKILKNNIKTKDIIKSSEKNQEIGDLILIIGVPLTVYSLWDLEHSLNNVNKSYEKQLIEIFLSIGIDVIGISFIINGNNYFNKAVDTYNNKVPYTFNYKRDLKVYLTYNGLGLVYRF